MIFARGYVALALLLSAAACQNAPATKDYAEFRSGERPAVVAARIAENVRACWFGGDRPAFNEFSHAPELASYSDRPRVLVVPKTDPEGLPRLVIEASRAERGSSVRLFGPLMGTAEAPVIAADVERWTGGATGC